MNRPLKILTGTANRAIVEEVSSYLNVHISDMLVTKFSDGEVRVQINESIRGADVYVFQSLSNPANQHIMELLLIIDALKRSSAGRITAVIPYFAYARQDRQDKPRTPVSARLLADLITVAGANRVVTIDLHSPQIQGFFDIPVDHLSALPVLHDYTKKNLILENPIVVSPDAGGVERARQLANKLGCGIAIIYKRRPEPNKAEVLDVVGDIEGKEAIIIDDLIDTAGTMVAAANMLINRGAKRVLACATHGVLSGPAVERLTNSPIEQVIITNTIPVEDKLFNKLKVVSVAPLLGEAIKRIHEEESVSSLFA
ncbi:ribose-phosphate pyrophosphokinase [Hydrogenivirga sp. 128-5-R1-1]|uniref:ribose-phosphate diphosphokinase n=1 Tax=Hydrogenivirga sp. 128-5-R1-1 TaxID=392423 RepID=UPI00015EF741|nr:ribose-phosphate pyrophosphokinase [Hydrogenivirga sp. 128-5-R1-1]EDP74945.1 phosphoribosylpyrophosphate synthetase [Hydrogenivirga sp. 128-5-R1-1]